jgi:hypothetical protein
VVYLLTRADYDKTFALKILLKIYNQKTIAMAQADNSSNTAAERFRDRFYRRFLSRRWLVVLVLVVIVFGLAASFSFLLSLRRGIIAAPDPQKWQAIFLNNGQVYFGHLLNVKNEYVLTNVYYLRVSQSLQPPASTAPAFDLVKLGGELHGPEDTVYFERSSVLFWENLKSDSQVVRAINNFQKSSGH